MKPEAEFFDEIQTKVFKVFLFAIHSHLYSFAMRFIFFTLLQPLTYFFNSRNLLHIKLLFIVKKKGGKPDRNPIPSSLWFKKSIQKPQVWELSTLCPETSMKLHVHEFGFW
jgi:hypothetical protein